MWVSLKPRRHRADLPTIGYAAPPAPPADGQPAAPSAAPPAGGQPSGDAESAPHPSESAPR